MFANKKWANIDWQKTFYKKYCVVVHYFRLTVAQCLFKTYRLISLYCPHSCLHVCLKGFRHSSGPLVLFVLEVFICFIAWFKSMPQSSLFNTRHHIIVTLVTIMFRHTFPPNPFPLVWTPTFCFLPTALVLRPTCSWVEMSGWAGTVSHFLFPVCLCAFGWLLKHD